MNSSIQDAVSADTESIPAHLTYEQHPQFNLGWKLALALKGHATPSLLPSFEIERMPVIADMLKITTELYERSFNTDTQRKLAAARAAEQAGPAGDDTARERGWFRGRKLFQLDINYRWSPVVLDERLGGGESVRVAYGEPEQDVRAGDRAPDAPIFVEGKGTRLFDIFSPTYHTILFFGVGDKAEEVLDVLRGFPAGLVKILLVKSSKEATAAIFSGVDTVVEDKEGHARKGYGLDGQEGPVAVAVRPDGMIGAFATSAKGLEKYFSLVFSHV